MIKFKIRDGEQRKKEGLRKVGINSKIWLRDMRDIAKSIAQQKGKVSIDDLRVVADIMHFHPHHPNTWGAVFRGKEWLVWGYKKSTYKTNNARRICIWRYWR